MWDEYFIGILVHKVGQTPLELPFRLDVHFCKLRKSKVVY